MGIVPIGKYSNGLLFILRSCAAFGKVNTVCYVRWNEYYRKNVADSEGVACPGEQGIRACLRGFTSQKESDNEPAAPVCYVPAVGSERR